MNAQMSRFFRDEKQEGEDDEYSMDISPLSVAGQQFHNLSLHSPSSRRKRSETRTKSFSPTQIFKFHNLTLDSPNPGQMQPLEEANKDGFTAPKRKRPLSPGLHTKREGFTDPQRHTGSKRSRTNPSMSWQFGHAEESPVRSRVKELPEYLDPDNPFFVKCMLRSNVSVCFMLTMPKEFCELHLPSCDTAKIILKDKEGKEFETIFLADKRTLSGGWKGFCQAKGLRLDDVLVFQLVSPLKFKVYKLEYALDADDADAAFILLKMSASEQRPFEENPQMPPPKDVFYGNIGETRLVTLDLNVEPVDDEESENRMADQEFGSCYRSGSFNPARNSCRFFQDVSSTESVISMRMMRRCTGLGDIA